MHAPGETHIVWMVVQHQYAQRVLGRETLLRNTALNQRPAQVVKVTAAHEYRAMQGRELVVHGGSKAFEAAQAAAKAHELLPAGQRQAPFMTDPSTSSTTGGGSGIMLLGPIGYRFQTAWKNVFPRLAAQGCG